MEREERGRSEKQLKRTDEGTIKKGGVNQRPATPPPPPPKGQGEPKPKK
jgi:hypothetical protein